MKHLTILSFLFVVLIAPSYGQDSLYRSQWLVSPSFGINTPITKALDNSDTNPLFQYDDHSLYYQVSGSYFFKKHWGVCLEIQLMQGKNTTPRSDRFSKQMESSYGNNFFVTPSSGADYAASSEMDGSRVLTGIGYRYYTTKALIYPKMLIGLQSFYTDWGTAVLKEKNSNQEISISFDPKTGPNDLFMIALGNSFGYRISRRLNLSADVMLSYFRLKTDFEKNKTDLINDQILSQEEIKLRKNVFTLSTGLRLGIGF